MLQLPTAYGAPPARGRSRSSPEDFRGDEILGFEPDDAGEHAFLTVEKRGANTGWVALALARAAGVAPRDVGWSGQKDRDAVTVQSYSLPWPATQPLDALLGLGGEGYRVRAVRRHGRKLRPGSHRGNRFELRIRELSGDRDALEQRLRLIAAQGVPDYFGPQRFGREGANLARARHWALTGHAPRDRSQRSFALSAARSAVFNAVLAGRVLAGSWNRLLDGEAVMLDGSRSFFRSTAVDESLAARCAALDVHPSGPLWGRGESPAAGEALVIERGIAAGEPDLLALLEAQGLEHERRSLRLRVLDAAWAIEGDVLELSFELARGAFATSVLHEVLVDAWTTGGGGD